MRSISDFKKSEAESCEAFIASLSPQWKVYRETEGWDILLSGPDDVQVGIQGKCTGNLKVLYQALDGHTTGNGPDYRVVLIGQIADSAFNQLCHQLGIGLLQCRWERNYRTGLVEPLCCDIAVSMVYDWHPVKRCKLPDYIPEGVAGAPCPKVLTKWKVAALNISAILERRGFVTPKDFRDLHIDRRRWVTRKWIVAGSDKSQYVANPTPADREDMVARIRRENPVVYASVLSKYTT